MKICSKCQEKFPNTSEYFHKDKSRHDKLNHKCKVCNKKSATDWAKTNQKDRQNYMKKYNKTHKKEIREYKRKWNRKNSQYFKDYRKKHKDKLNINAIKRSKQYAIYEIYALQLDFCEKVRQDPQNNNLLQVKCTESSCKKWLNPTNRQVQNRIKYIKGQELKEARFYCSDKCKQNCVIFNQIKYPKNNKPYYRREVQKELAGLVFTRDNYECQKCGNKEKIQCHHFDGILYEPLLSADIEECITLCKDCHKDAHSEDGCRYADLQCK